MKVDIITFHGLSDVGREMQRLQRLLNMNPAAQASNVEVAFFVRLFRHIDNEITDRHGKGEAEPAGCQIDDAIYPLVRVEAMQTEDAAEH